MTADEAITEVAVSKRYQALRKDADAHGYFLNPDESFTRNLVHGLLTNLGRYGYEACPCRLASGRIDEDRDIICPCEYRDPDLGEFGSCYCSLYVAPAIARKEASAVPIPDRRPSRKERSPGSAPAQAAVPGGGRGAPVTVWRCRVCGYLCARDQPPLVCPICKADKDRFETFAIGNPVVTPR